VKNYRRELTEFRDAQANQGIAEDYIDHLYYESLRASDPEFGNVFQGSADVSLVIQRALDKAESLGGFRRVVMPAGGAFVAANLRVPSFVWLDLNNCMLISPIGATGFMIGNKSINSQRYVISNGWLQCRGYAVRGIDLNHDGGTYGADAADPEPTLTRILVTNSAVDSFRFTATRVISGFRLRSRASTGHGFTFLPGSAGPADPDQTNDCIFLGCSASSAGGDCVHMETDSNQLKGFKIGEAHAGRGLYMGVNASNCHVELIVDNSGADIVLDDVQRNVVTVGCQNAFAAGAAIQLINAASYNIIRGFAWQNGANMTYAISCPPGCVGNDICMVAPGMTTALVDPASDTVNNRIWVNGRPRGEQIKEDISLAAGQNFVNATLTNTALSHPVTAGKTYAFWAKLVMAPDAAGGHKYTVAGTCTATAIEFTIRSFQSTPAIATVIDAHLFALGGAAGQNGATACETWIYGSITVNASGTLVIQAAQNGAAGTTLMRRGSSFHIRESRPV
jgi:hypothetical protein